MIELLLTLALVGVLLYFVEMLPIAAPMVLLIRVVVVLCCIVFLVRLFGLDMPVPRMR